MDQIKGHGIWKDTLYQQIAETKYDFEWRPVDLATGQLTGDSVFTTKRQLIVKGTKSRMQRYVGTPHTYAERLADQYEAQLKQKVQSEELNRLWKDRREEVHYSVQQAGIELVNANLRIRQCNLTVAGEAIYVVWTRNASDTDFTGFREFKGFVMHYTAILPSYDNNETDEDLLMDFLMRFISFFDKTHRFAY
jgi:hypothetical protein